MNNKKILIYLSSMLAVLIPCPGRFAYGIVLIVSFNLIFILAVLLNALLRKLNIDAYSRFLLPLLIVSLVTIAKLILVFICPVIAMQLSFIYYLLAFSIYLHVFNFEENEDKLLKMELKKQLTNCIWFTCLTFGFTLIREILGYGTISFPAFSGLYNIRLFKINSLTFMNFFASIPGAAIISAIIISVALQVNKEKVETPEVNNE